MLVYSVSEELLVLAEDLQGNYLNYFLQWLCCGLDAVGSISAGGENFLFSLPRSDQFLGRSNLLSSGYGGVFPTR